MRLLTAIFLTVAMSLGPVWSKDVTKRVQQVKWNGTDARYSKGEWTFELAPDGCGRKTYGDGRGESDCGGGRRRSQIQLKEKARVGQQLSYSFEFFIPKDFVYDGDPRYPAFSRLLFAEWKRDKGIKNHLYEILLDSRRGVTFERKPCVTPREFGKWNHFELRVNWTGKADGYLEARCNGRQILKRLGQQTLVLPDCAANYKLQCDPKLQQPDGRILWSIGPNLSGYGRDYRRLGRSTPFPPFPPRGVEISVRKIDLSRIRN